MTHGTAFLPNPELKLYPVSPFVFRAHVLLLIDLLEEEPDDCVRFAIADTFGKARLRSTKS